MIGLLGGVAEGGFANLPPGLLPVLVECGVDLSVGSTASETPETGDVAMPTTPIPPLDVSELDPELAAVAECLRETWGGDAFDEITAGLRLPTFPEIGAISECGFDLSQLGELAELLQSS